jgi:double-strand break repair protein MRE11
MCRHVGILSIQGSQFQIAEVPLKTVRPFQLAEVVLTKAAEDESTKVNLEDKDSITAYLRKEVRMVLSFMPLRLVKADIHLLPGGGFDR